MEPADTLFIYMDACLRDADVFPRPDEFDPERWLSSTPDRLARMHIDFLTFGYGGRQCPGLVLAKTEIIVASAVLVGRFDFQLGCPVADVQRVLKYQARPNQLPVIFSERSDL